MRLSLRNRALVALALSLSLVGLSASPAHATLMSSDSENRSNVNLGRADLHYIADAPLASQVHSQYFAEKRFVGDGSDKWTCTETWTDQRTYSHRPPDVAINCRTGNERTGGLHQLHYVNSSGNPGNILRSSDINSGGGGIGPDVLVCRIDIRNMWRSSSNCQGTGVDLSDKDGMAWSSFRNINNVNEPEYIDMTAVNGIGVQDVGMYKGDALVSPDGMFTATMQSDGNFVIYSTSSGSAVWAISSCLAPGKSLVADSHILPQSDGNLVVYTPTNGVVWASANVNSCTHGSFGTGGAMYMQEDGNLVFYGSGGALWARSW